MIKVIKNSTNLSTWYLDPGVPTDGDGKSFDNPFVWQLHSSNDNKNFDYTAPEYGNYVYVLLKLTSGTTYNGNIVAHTGPITYQLYDNDDPNTVLKTFSYYDSTSFSFSVDKTGFYIFKCGQEFYSSGSTETLTLNPSPDIITGESSWKKKEGLAKGEGWNKKTGKVLKYRNIESAGIKYFGLWDNTKNTKFYLNFTQQDIAKGNDNPYAPNLSSITWDEENNPVFNTSGSSYLSIPNFDKNIFGSGKEWTFDFWMKLSSNYSSWNNILVQTNNSNGDNYLNESIGLGINSTPSLCFYYAARNCGLKTDGVKIYQDNLIPEQWYHIAVDKYIIDGVWHITYYVNGTVATDISLTKEITPYQSHDVSFGGVNDDSGRRFRGTLCKLRITDIALFKGNNFTIKNRI